ncbi:MAG: hypothetical protein ABR992_14770 [Solirubrobacteraceae bacterium]|jgi:LEA14-like dessication related protein
MLIRRVAVGSVSLVLVTSAVSYAITPAGTAIAAVVAAVASPAGHEAIEGKVQGSGVTVRIVKLVNGKTTVVATTKVGRNGHFDIPVKPGSYKMVIMHGSKQVVEKVKVTSGHSAFIVVKVSQTGGGLGIAPVIFNY